MEQLSKIVDSIMKDIIDNQEPVRVDSLPNGSLFKPTLDHPNVYIKGDRLSEDTQNWYRRINDLPETEEYYDCPMRGSTTAGMYALGRNKVYTLFKIEEN